MQQPWRVKETNIYSIRATATDSYGYPLILKAAGRVWANQSSSGLNYGGTKLVQGIDIGEKPVEQ
jgi:hypothetical protein